MADARTPYKIGLIRMAIIRAMIEGRITYRTAMDLQRMTSNVGLTMAAERLGITGPDEQRVTRLFNRLVARNLALVQTSWG